MCSNTPRCWQHLLLSLLVSLLFASTSRGQSTVSHQDLSRYVDHTGDVQFIRTPANWAIRRAAILEGFQQAAGSMPSRENLPPFDLQIKADEEFKGVRRLTGSIQVEANDRLPLDIYLPESVAASVSSETLLDQASSVSVPGILALHPTGAAGKRIVAGEKPNRQYAVELAQRGYVVVAPDYMSFGEYADYDFESDEYTSGTMKGIFNHMRCVDLLGKMSVVDADRLGVIGHSLGGHNAIFVGVFDARLKVVVSSCGWTPFHYYYGGKLEGWTSARYMPLIRDQYNLDPDRVPFDFYELVAALAPRTFVSVSPINDSNFDVVGVRKAMPLAKQIYELLDADQEITLLTPECQHDFPTDMRLSSYEVMDRVLHFKPQQIAPDYSTELPRIGSTEAGDAHKTFQTAEGYQLQQTAAEPRVTDPVAMAFDEDGRLYVVEMKGYSEQSDELRGQIRLLEDRDNDGLFEGSRVFAKDFSWPTAIAVYNGGVFVGAAPNIYYLKDTTGDGIADKRQTVFSGFGKGNVQGLLNSFHWGQDGRIYGATSSSAGEVSCPPHQDRPVVKLRSRDFSFDPVTLSLREETGGAQHGMSFDDFGNRFVCSNSDHAQAIVFDQRYLKSNPFVKPAPGRVSIAVDGGQAPVFRTSPVEPWRIVRTRLRVSGRVRGPVEGGGRPAGYFTGATGITVYRGDAWPEEMRGNLIIGDVGSNIVHRKKRQAQGVIWTATRIDDGKELVSSTDVWFRPVQFLNAPDGCLHVLDMYRETIEHPASLPPEIKRHVDLTSGRDRGRLYRIVPNDYEHRPTPQLSKASTSELVALLGHANGWHTDTASRLLYERQDPDTVELLQSALKESLPATAIVRALSLLAHFDGLDVATVTRFLKHEHPRVRERAVLLSESWLDDSGLLEEVGRMVEDDDARVRLQAGFTLGMTDSKARVRPLVSLLKSNGADRWLRTAAMTSLNDLTWPAVEQLVTDQYFLASGHAKPILNDLIDVALRRPDAPDAASVIRTIRQISGARTLQRDLLQLTLELRSDWRQLQEPAELASSIVTSAAPQADDHEVTEAVRIDAIRALTLSSWDQHGDNLFQLLDASEPPAIQAAAMETLASFADGKVAEALLEGWLDLSPAVRQQALAALLNRSNWTKILLHAIDGGDISAAVLSAADLQRLASHPEKEISAVARNLVEAAGTSSRQQVISEYRPALAMAGDAERGAKVFSKTCVTCHKVGNSGHEVGPNLLSVRNRGMEFILLNVLDPNREVLPAWHDYVAVTADGRTWNGIVTQESPVSVTLRRAEARESKLLRSDIDILRDTGRSLMPADLEKTLSVQDMADLLAWLQEQ